MPIWQASSSSVQVGASPMLTMALALRLGLKSIIRSTTRRADVMKRMVVFPVFVLLKGPALRRQNQGKKGCHPARAGCVALEIARYYE